MKIETLCYIHHFHIDHNACTFFTNHCFQYFSCVVMQNLGVNMVHYGLCENGDCGNLSWIYYQVHSLFFYHNYAITARFTCYKILAF